MSRSVDDTSIERGECPDMRRCSQADVLWIVRDRKNSQHKDLPWTT